MRSRDHVQVGSAGVSAVCRDFELIGWGPVRNPEHDRGTDLFVQACSEHGSDFRLVVGVQVKTGPHYFKQAMRGEGGKILGWWYYESDPDHFDDWTTHGLPHLLVLHDLDRDMSYWVHVTPDRVERTGKGSKILVPADQVIGGEHADDLFAVACKQKAASVLEGSAIAGLPGGIPPGRRLRYAMVAPRLVAPHPNAPSSDPIDPVEAVALLAEGRFRDLAGISEKHPSVPDPKQPYLGREWGWQFTAAVWDWATTDSVEQLEEVFADARTTEEAAASGVLLACASNRNERCNRALQVLDELTGGNRLSPADRGWVLVQRARFKAETGDFAGSQADAVEAQRCFAGDQDDVTVSALAAAAAWQLYSAAFMAGQDWDSWGQDFKEMISAADTAVSWWRAQTLSGGLAAAEKDRFETWAGPYTKYLIKWDGTTSQELFSAEFTSDVGGEHSQWKHACALFGRHRLIGAADSSNEADELREGLGALRRSGDDQSLEMAIRRLRHDGPLGPLVAAVNSIRTGRWTHTTASGNFAALAQAGDLVEEPSATELACWSAEALEDSSDPNHRLNPLRIPPMSALDAAAGLLPAAASEAHCRVARIVAAIPDPPPHMTAECVAAAITSLDYTKVDNQGRQALWDKARTEPGRTGVAALRWLTANNHPGAEAEAISRTAGGHLSALEAVADLSALNPADATAIIGLLAESAAQNLVDARSGSHGGDRIDAAYWLARMNVEHPEQARWDEAVEMLLDPATAGHDKIDACLRIAENPDAIPEEVRNSLAENIALIGRAQRGIGFDTDIGGTETVMSMALGALSEDAAAAAMAKLASGTPEQRRDAATLLGWGQQPAQQPILGALIADHHPLVRHEAAIAIGRLAAVDPTPPIAALGWILARKDGILLPAGLLSGLARNSSRLATPFAADIAHYYLQHPSAILRNGANTILR